jgi:hypothetical protein
LLTTDEHVLWVIYRVKPDTFTPYIDEAVARNAFEAATS